MGSLFIDNIKKFLNTQTYQFSRKERDKACELIKRHFAQTNFVSKGPCIQCNIVIEYSVSSTHSTKGDEWYRTKLLNGWKKDYHIHLNIYNMSQLRINGLGLRTIRGYLCTDCLTQLEIAIERKRTLEIEAHNARIRQEKKQKKAYRERDKQIYNGEIKSSPVEQFNALKRLATNDDWTECAKHILTMDYQDFLQSKYWNIIRKCKLHLAGYKCQLCSSNDQLLNVHHSTYDHHGFEHLHLGDLIVLCEDCHAKFHKEKVS